MMNSALIYDHHCAFDVWFDFFLLSLGMERIHFSTENTDVEFLGHNGEPTFSGIHFS
jgi:hypothetical protein